MEVTDPHLCQALSRLLGPARALYELFDYLAARSIAGRRQLSGDYPDYPVLAYLFLSLRRKLSLLSRLPRLWLFALLVA